MKAGFFRFILIFLVLHSIYSGPAQALRLDNFEGDQTVIAAGPGTIEYSTLATSSAAGGFRTIQAQVLSGTFMFSLTGLGIFSHSQGADVTGVSMLTWDGDNVSPNLNASGLAGLDITQDFGDSIQLKILSFDLPFGNPASITFTVFDASDPSGQTSSATTLTLDQVITTDTVIDLPFANFLDIGSAGAADFTNVGAVTMYVNGDVPAVDLEIDFFGTNGICDLVPVNGQVIDECDVCGGDGSSCADCVGVPNGPAVPGTACTTGSSGVCGAGTYDEECGCVQDVSSSAETCDGLDNDCNGEVDGQVCLDACESFDLTGTSFELDGGAKEQEHLIRAVLTQLKKLKSDPKTLKFVKQTRTKAHTLQIINWTISWQLPPVAVVCPQTSFCVEISNLPILDEYRFHSEELRKIFYEVVGKLKKAGKKFKSAKDKKFLRAANLQHEKNMALADTVPVIQSQCVGF